jgi:hypothetical protein
MSGVGGMIGALLPSHLTLTMNEPKPSWLKRAKFAAEEALMSIRVGNDIVSGAVAWAGVGVAA